MKASEYHYELNPICNNLLKSLEFSDAKAEDVELEIKQAQVKKCFDSQMIKRVE